MFWIAAIFAAIAGAAVGAWLVRRAQHRATTSDQHPTAAPSSPEGAGVRPVTPVTPMTGLESALDGVTDRSGRTLREQIDAEAAEVDQLRVADDTSPILRRALDRYAAGTPAGDGPRDDGANHTDDTVG